MKPAGFLCKIDKLGRIVVPKPLRTKFDLKIDDTIELFTDDESIILKKYRESCIFCGSDEELVAFQGKTVCKRCAAELSKI
ncbi:MAG: AbrB/MazE/SpoVT family DNA-binding domain-containing protein [Ruminococcus sp.]|nr:AbrB/MazE/SpoVT family DNA-binding domain-containing protein [Ruminococcus sp.]